MIMLECSTDRPWGIHANVRNDEDCPRCGWTAPGPKGDAVLDAVYAAEEAQWLRGRAAAMGWTVIEGGGGGDCEALAA
jgi:hypothetical protein